MIFIDGSNMYHSLKAYYKRTDIDMGAFCKKLAGDDRLIRSYYYNAEVSEQKEPERYVDQKKFFDGISAIPCVELRLGQLVYTNGWPATPPYEKGIDVQLATDMLLHAFRNNYDRTILVAGDNDFAGAVQAVKDAGKNIEVALFGQEGTSKHLREVADSIITLDKNFMRDCWKNKRRVVRRRTKFDSKQRSSSKLKDSNNGESA